jgi:hypothetical protein
MKEENAMSEETKKPVVKGLDSQSEVSTAEGTLSDAVLDKVTGGGGVEFDPFVIKKTQDVSSQN